MTSKKSIVGMSVLVLFLATLFVGNVWAGEAMTIVGTVSDDGNIVDESGKIYEIGDNDMAAEVSEKSGAKVEVKGTVEEGTGDNETIMIESYKVIE
ncbi:MAG: hypothetical protein JSW26_24240 [Desulfobacterales bacterium]|nr:MAG: hypothetical protein JSW26_24240 [Desulfobacterales bacterium]